MPTRKKRKKKEKKERFSLVRPSYMKCLFPQPPYLMFTEHKVGRKRYFSPDGE
jgi:hypothetical protein